MKRRQSLFSKLTTPNLLVAIMFISIFTMATRVPFDTDTWWHLRSGLYILENSEIPITDPFSFTQAGQLWIDAGWLAQVFWYEIFALGGWAAVSLMLAALVTLAFWFVWRQIEANVFIAALAMILGAIVSSVVWAARPQMISFVFTAITAYLLHSYKRHDKSLLPWLPLVMLLWVNVHGGFAIGFMIMVAYLIGEAVNNITQHDDDPVVSWGRLKHLLLTMLICLAVVVINPHTWRMWLYPFQTVGIGALRDFIQEWQSPNFHLIWQQPFILMLLLIIAAVARTRRRADWTDLALLAMWTIWALFAGRNIAIFALLTTPILARYADLAWAEQWQTWGYELAPFAHSGAINLKSRIQRLKLKINWVVLGLIVLVALLKTVLPLLPKSNLDVEQSSLPYHAVEFIRETQPPGPIFNSYNWGGYVIFQLWPDYPVYIDGRTDLYDDAFIRRYLDVMVANEDWQQTLQADGINLVFIEQGSILAKFMVLDPAWTEIYKDDMAVIYSRNEPILGDSE